ncbi:unnamed protein product [Dracunculus medinensis]|uniref:RING-type domain-containing protein n=1 Tax=Dracunculus medinensis TaxID=318479 RepID=A0A0N4UQ30_DRAME|nr:unnamed protein product [Dracunculus medinensis]
MRECPKCKTSDYNNPSFVMLINECGHPLCRNCVNNLFARNSAACPRCGKILLKKGFWEQTFSSKLEKELNIRKRLKKIFNLKRDDFGTLREYNDYLERIEIFVFNLVDGINVTETEAEINRFKNENASLIDRNRYKLSEDEEWIMQHLENEKKIKLSASFGQEKEVLGKSSRETKTKEIIDELKHSDLPAEVILDRRRKRQIEAELFEKENAAKRKKKSKLEAQQKRQETASFAPVRVSGRPFVYRPPELPINGPALPSVEQISNGGFLQHIRTFSAARRVGGFTAEICCMRALFESRIDLFAF